MSLIKTAEKNELVAELKQLKSRGTNIILEANSVISAINAIKNVVGSDTDTYTAADVEEIDGLITVFRNALNNV